MLTNFKMCLPLVDSLENNYFILFDDVPFSLCSEIVCRSCGMSHVDPPPRSLGAALLGEDTRG